MELDGEDIDILGVLRDFNTSDLSYLRLVTGDVELVVSRLEVLPDEAAAVSEPSTRSRGHEPAPEASAEPDGSQEVPAEPPPAPLTVAGPAAATAREVSDDGLTMIPSPVVGIFYRAPAPGEDPYVSEGSEVEPGTTIGLVEAMKVFTAVAAGTEGTIEEILVSNDDFVEVGQPLMTVRRTSG